MRRTVFWYFGNFLEEKLIYLLINCKPVYDCGEGVVGMGKNPRIRGVKKFLGVHVFWEVIFAQDQHPITCHDKREGI